MADIEKIIISVEDAFDFVYSELIGTDDFDETGWEQEKENALALLKEQKHEKTCCKDCEYYFSCHDN